MKKFLILGLFLALTGCENVVLRSEDVGKTLNLSVGEKFSIRLPENPTTGYGWEMITKPENQDVVLEVKNEFLPDQRGLIGAGGERVFQYQAKESGKVDIYGFYRRPWEKDVTPARSVMYQIIVE